MDLLLGSEPPPLAPPKATEPEAVPGGTGSFAAPEKRSEAGDKTLWLVDASGFIFRAYHALPGLTTSKGVPTNAVLGFTRMVLKVLREFDPTYFALCFDKDSRRGRLEIDPTYKANRAETPPDLLTQFEWIRKIVAALNVPIIEVPGWEADDVVGTLAKRAKAEGFKVKVITSDKDFIQIIEDGVELYDPVKDAKIGEAEAVAKYGVKPSQMIDYLALIGDSIDNVAKVPGIGPKTAVDLLAQFGGVDAMLGRLDEIKKPKIREAIAGNLETLKRAKQLVSFKLDLPLEEVTFEGLKRQAIRERDARDLFSELEFFRLIQEMPAAKPTPITTNTAVVSDIGALKALAAEVAGSESVTLIPAFEGLPYAGELAGLAVALPSGKTAYVPLRHGGRAYFSKEQLAEGLGEVFHDPKIKKNGHDLKTLWHLLASVGVALGGADGDVELLSYLLNPSRREHALSDLARERLRLELPPPPGAAASGRRKRAITDVMVEEAAVSFGASADAARRMVPDLWDEMEKVGLAHVARDLELPLLPILGRMERAGVKVDLEALKQISTRVEAACAEGLKKIYEHAGREFNVGSPIQLSQVLFDELKLPILKRGKTGPSTDQEVLEKLAQQHPLPNAIIEYRNVSKLKSTYLDTLPLLVAADGRVHTTFHQAAAATGRLSSTDPNLQNIPIRTELGREIRRAFVAEPGNVLISADYSQIELRLLAHIAGDPALVEAFAADADVHTRTASEVFGVPPEAVTSGQRRAAKMVNYGIAYGLSPHGLSTRLDISVEEARSILERYFARYTGIAKYMDETIDKARRSGFVETLFGRRRYMPDLGSRNRNIAMAAERAAINMPIQGTAADLIKKAMLTIDAELTARKWKSRMLLQVHDELLFEAPEAEAKDLVDLARAEMSKVASFKVPLKVDVGTGHSWADAH